MKSQTEHLTFHTRRHREYIRITDRVEDVVARSGISEGMVLVSAMHITAGRLDLGPWQQVFYAEFDGQRPKRLVSKGSETMTITFQCEHCHKQVQAPDAAAGKRGKCPHCGHSSYIPAPVSEEEVLDLAPIDEAEERARKEKIHNLLEQEEKLLQETGGAEPPPLERRENLSAADLHHFVVNYCLDMSQSNLARAEKHAAELKKFGPLGLEAVSDFVTGKALEPALDPIPVKVLQAFLTDLRDKLHA